MISKIIIDVSPCVRRQERSAFYSFPDSRRCILCVRGAFYAICYRFRLVKRKKLLILRRQSIVRCSAQLLLALINEFFLLVSVAKNWEMIKI